MSLRRISLPGREMFEDRCGTCHGADGNGGEHAPAITRASQCRDSLQAFREALGSKTGIRRYGTGFNANGTPGKGEAYVPMDECLARCVIDFSGRPCLVWRGMDQYSQRAASRREREQDMSSTFRFGLAREFFQGYANEARCNLHMELLYGDEPHHIVEELFKAFAKAADFACRRDSRIAWIVPSTKGRL